MEGPDGQMDEFLVDRSRFSLWEMALFRVSDSGERLQTLVGEISEILDQFSNLIGNCCQVSTDTFNHPDQDGYVIPEKPVCDLLNIPYLSSRIYVRDFQAFEKVFDDVMTVKEEPAQVKVEPEYSPDYQPDLYNFDIDLNDDDGKDTHSKKSASSATSKRVKPDLTEQRDFCISKSYQSDFPVDEDSFNDMKAGRVPMKCPNCPVTFQTLYGMVRHFRNKKCKFVPNITNFKEVKDELDGRLKFVCTFPGCSDSDRLWKTKDYLYKHWGEAHESSCDLRVSCRHCDKKFLTKGVLRLHLHAKHKREEGKVYSCSLCGKMMANMTALRDHEMRHKGIKRFRCEHCGHQTITKSALNSHLKYSHAELFGVILRSHVCDQCGKSFKAKSALREHMWTHSEQPHPQFQCPICSKYLKQSNSFKKHMMNVHKVHHSCDCCPKVFATEAGLIRHKVDIHGGAVVL